MRPHQFGAVLLENASRAPHPRWRVTEGCTSQNGEMRESLEFPAHFLGPADLVLRRLDWRKIVSVYGIRVVLKAGISRVPTGLMTAVIVKQQQWFVTGNYVKWVKRPSAADWPARKQSRYASVGLSIIQLSKIRGAANS